MTTRLQFRRVTGEHATAEADLGEADFPAGEFLVARRARLEDGTELRQHRVAKTVRRSPGYGRLDNEILAGRLLYEVAERSSSGYPAELARLYGDEASSAEPYALLEPYRGEPLSQVGTHLLAEEQEQVQVSLLAGLCWLAAAGIAHRALNPDTVLWDSHRCQVQIIDFSQSTVFGTPRQVRAGAPNWTPREQRPGGVSGLVGEGDDIWAAGKLIFFVHNQGEELADRSQLTDSGLAKLLDQVFGPPEDRPTAELVVKRMGRPSPLPRAARGLPRLNDGHSRFWDARARKHPGAAVPPEAAGYAARPPGPAPPGASGAAAGDAGAVADAGTTVVNGMPEADTATAHKAGWLIRSRWRRGAG